MNSEKQNPILNNQLRPHNEYEKERIEKALRLRDGGINPYSNIRIHLTPFRTIKDVAKSDNTLETNPYIVTVAGRVVLKRDMGNLNFLTIRQDGEDLQIAIQKNNVSADCWSIWKLMDAGDIIYATGPVRPTKSGEITVWATEIAMGAKAIAPPPAKHEGLIDVELRQRNRHVDLWSNPDVYKTFILRSKILHAIRQYMKQNDFVEVETPYMHSVLGGANAKPFTTHHNTLDIPLYLRIAPELFLKRLLIGGLSRVYEIGKNFRNEGISPRHNPEFTVIEIYQAFANYKDMMDLAENLYCEVCRYLEIKLENRQKWRRVSLSELIKEHGKDISGMTDDEAMKLYESEIQPNLVAPTFVTHFPASHVPLCAVSLEQPRFAEGFELIIDGQEIGPGYTECNDPEQQMLNFARQRGEDAVDMDKDFIEAMKVGMPPAGGIGIGIDRLCMVLLNQQSIRDVILFPLHRPNTGG